MEILRSLADKKHDLSDSFANMRKGLRLAQFDLLEAGLKSGRSSNGFGSSVTVTREPKACEIVISHPHPDIDEASVDYKIIVGHYQNGSIHSVRAHFEERDRMGGLIDGGDYYISNGGSTEEQGLTGRKLAANLRLSAHFQTDFTPVEQ